MDFYSPYFDTSARSKWTIENCLFMKYNPNVFPQTRALLFALVNRRVSGDYKHVQHNVWISLRPILIHPQD